MPKQAKTKRDGVINQQNYKFNRFFTRTNLMLSNATNQPKSTVELGFMCRRGLSGPLAVTPPSSWNIKRDFYWDVCTILNRIKLTVCTICAFRVPNPEHVLFQKVTQNLLVYEQVQINVAITSDLLIIMKYDAKSIILSVFGRFLFFENTTSIKTVKAVSWLCGHPSLSFWSIV